MKKGFYWVKFQGKTIVGKFDPEEEPYPWTIVGSDNIFGSSELTVIGPFE